MITYKLLERHGNELWITMDIDGELYQQRMPDTTLSVRAGEYGLDPVADYDTVMDIIMWEMFVPHDPSEMHPAIVTAPTLEEARDIVLAKCREVKEQHAVAGRGAVDQDHEDILVGLRENFVADPQLALLTRGAMKDAVMLQRSIIQKNADDPRTHVQKMKAEIIDDIRRREEV